MQRMNLALPKTQKSWVSNGGGRCPSVWFDSTIRSPGQESGAT